MKTIKANASKEKIVEKNRMKNRSPVYNNLYLEGDFGSGKISISFLFSRRLSETSG
jgi:predicted ATPase